MILLGGLTQGQTFLRNNPALLTGLPDAALVGRYFVRWMLGCSFPEWTTLYRMAGPPGRRGWASL